MACTTDVRDPGSAFVNSFEVGYAGPWVVVELNGQPFVLTPRDARCLASGLTQAANLNAGLDPTADPNNGTTERPGGGGPGWGPGVQGNQLVE
jgi:hypothetical protein